MKEVKLSKDSAPVKVEKIETIGSIEQLNQLISEGKLKIMIMQTASESLRTMISQPNGSTLKVSQPIDQVWKVETQNQPETQIGILKANSFFEEIGNGIDPIIKTFDQPQDALYIKNKSTTNILNFSVNDKTFTLDPLEFFDDGLDPFIEISINLDGSFKGYGKRLKAQLEPSMQFFDSRFFDSRFFG